MIKFVLSIELMFVEFEIHAQSVYFNKLYGKANRAEAGFGIIAVDSNYYINTNNLPDGICTGSITVNGQLNSVKKLVVLKE